MSRRRHAVITRVVNVIFYYVLLLKNKIVLRCTPLVRSAKTPGFYAPLRCCEERAKPPFFTAIITGYFLRN
jgi:hypothetical protein